MTKQTLFTQKDCVPLPSDLVGEILVLRTDFFFDEYKRPEYQLVYCEHDYKKSDNLFCRFLIDREKSDYQPSDFIGVLKPELVPEWAAKKVKAIINRKGREARAAMRLAGKLEKKGAFLCD